MGWQGEEPLPGLCPSKPGLCPWPGLVSDMELLSPKASPLLRAQGWWS